MPDTKHYETVDGKPSNVRKPDPVTGLTITSDDSADDAKVFDVARTANVSTGPPVSFVTPEGQGVADVNTMKVNTDKAVDKSKTVAYDKNDPEWNRLAASKGYIVEVGDSSGKVKSECSTCNGDNSGGDHTLDMCIRELSGAPQPLTQAQANELRAKGAEEAAKSGKPVGVEKPVKFEAGKK